MGQSGNEAADELEVGTEEFLQYFVMGVVLFAISVIIFWFAETFGGAKDPAEEQQGGRQQRVGAANRRQLMGARGRHLRRVDESDSEIERDQAVGGGEGGAGPQRGQYYSDDVELDEKLNGTNFKLGAKKRAKLEAKAEKRAHREAEERMREERKAKQDAEIRERELREKQEREDEKRKEEEEKRLREEKARRDQVEYFKMKEMFTVEGEGCEVIEEEEEGNLIEKFVEHIKAKNVILFEELATQFGLKVPDAIDRLTTLVSEGRLTGVLDDRGKFIYICKEELVKFAKFIKQRGRVSIADLVENSVSLITLTPEEKCCRYCKGRMFQ